LILKVNLQIPENKNLRCFLSDVDTDEPDEKSILLYIAHLYKACPTLPNHPFRKEHDQVCNLINGYDNRSFFFCLLDSF
jgi:hypothetical protein